MGSNSNIHSDDLSRHSQNGRGNGVVPPRRGKGVTPDSANTQAGHDSIRQILVPLDGSPHSERVLPHAVAMARATSCELLLMRVVPPISLIEPMGGVAEGVPDLWRNYDGQPKLARRYLEDVAGRLFKANLQIDFSITEGEPAEAILKYVSEHPEIKAIAMSTHGRSGWSRWLFGSVAERVLHGSPVPLLLLRPGENRMRVDLEHTVVPRYSKLLVPLDGSQLAEQVLPHAISLARRMGGRLVLTSVTSTPFDLKVVKSDVYGEWSTVPWDTPAERNVRYLDSIAEKLTCDGMLVQGRVTCGDPAQEILRAVIDEQADIIVMATHGRGGLGRLLVGSVAERVAQAAGVPLLLVRAQGEPASRQLDQQVPAATTPKNTLAG